MRNLTLFLKFLFSPNPTQVAHYTTGGTLWLLILCAVLIIGSFGISFWRRRLTNPMTKKLSSSWSSAAFWFGIVGLILVVCRVERIQVLAMPFLWIILLIVVLGYLFLQFRLFRSRHYEILPKIKVLDERDKYLPTKRNR